MAKFRVIFMFCLAKICTVLANEVSVRIVGGDDAQKGQFPYIVSIREAPKWQRGHMCAGSLIDPKWVLTVGHCVIVAGNPNLPNEFEILVGTISYKRKLGTPYNISAIYIHPQFERKELRNDIALLKMSSPVVLTPEVGTISLGRLPPTNPNTVVTAGWGQTTPEPYGFSSRTLKFLFMQTMDIEKCQRIHSRWKNKVDGSTQICVTAGKGKSLCAGDSGGPVVATNGTSTGKLVGLFSGYQDCRGVYPNLLVRVEAYFGWISYITGIVIE